MDKLKLAEENKGLIRMIAQKYLNVCALERANDIDDLMQAGIIGVWDAAKTFKPESGKTWASWAAYYIRREMRNALGIATTRRRADLGAISLYQHIGDDPDGLTIEDTIPDNSLPESDAGVLDWDLRKQVHDAVDRLKNQRQRNAIMSQYFSGKSQAEIGEAFGITAQRVSMIVREGRRKLRQDRRLQEIAELELRMPYYHKVGVTRFNTTQTSAVEYAAIWREAHTQEEQQE